MHAYLHAYLSLPSHVCNTCVQLIKNGVQNANQSDVLHFECSFFLSGQLVVIVWRFILCSAWALLRGWVPCYQDKSSLVLAVVGTEQGCFWGDSNYGRGTWLPGSLMLWCGVGAFLCSVSSSALCCAP